MAPLHASRNRILRCDSAGTSVGAITAEGGARRRAMMREWSGWCSGLFRDEVVPQADRPADDGVDKAVAYAGVLQDVTHRVIGDALNPQGVIRWRER